MDYQTFQPHSDLASLIQCYWTLEVPATTNATKQRIVPDGCIEMAFILGDDIKRFVSETEYILQPRSMVLGQTIEPFYIQPTGYVNTFAVRFYPYGFANFVKDPIQNFANKETPLSRIFDEDDATVLAKQISDAANTQDRITAIEWFLMKKLNEQSTIDKVVKTTIDALLESKGNSSIASILSNDLSKRRQLERKFLQQIGISPKQLGKVIRLQTALKLLLLDKRETLTQIAYASEYYDQAHFIKDFKEFTGVNPKEFLESQEMTLSTLFYSQD